MRRYTLVLPNTQKTSIEFLSPILNVYGINTNSEGISAEIIASFRFYILTQSPSQFLTRLSVSSKSRAIAYVQSPISHRHVTSIHRLLPELYSQQTSSENVLRYSKCVC